MAQGSQVAQVSRMWFFTVAYSFSDFITHWSIAFSVMQYVKLLLEIRVPWISSLRNFL